MAKSKTKQSSLHPKQILRTSVQRHFCPSFLNNYDNQLISFCLLITLHIKTPLGTPPSTSTGNPTLYLLFLGLKDKFFLVCFSILSFNSCSLWLTTVFCTFSTLCVKNQSEPHALHFIPTLLGML